MQIYEKLTALKNRQNNYKTTHFHLWAFTINCFVLRGELIGQ